MKDKLQKMLNAKNTRKAKSRCIIALCRLRRGKARPDDASREATPSVCKINIT